jgi:autotransporter-associated beta strand protein
MAGTLKLFNVVALPSGTNLSVAEGATFDLDGASRPSVSSLTGAGTVTSSAGQPGAGILTVGGSSSSQFDGVLSGHLSLVKSGDGTLTLTKAATYDGSTDINAGTTGKGGIVIGVDNALPTGTSLVLNGTLDLGGAANKNGFNQTVARLRGLNGVIVNNGGADVTFTVSSPGNNDGFAGKIRGNLNFVKDGANTLTLAGENDYRGTTTIKAGTLRIDGDGSLPDGTRVTLQNAATLDFKGTEQTLGSLDGTANTSVKNSGIFAFELRVSPPANTTSTFAGQISGNLSLTMGGGGTLILTGSSTYGNKGEVTTTVSDGGTLTVNNKAGSGTGAGDVRVANGKLDGTGTIDGKVSTGNAGMVGNKLTINGGVETDGGKIGVGDTPGKLTIAQGLAMSAGGTYAWQLGALSEANPGTDFSFISLTSGMLALGANTTISLEFLNGTTPAAGVNFWAKSHTWDVIALANKNQNPNSTNFGSLENARFEVGEFTTVLGGPSGADILLKFTPTTLPEPPALVMLCLGLSTLVAVDRLRRRQVNA